MGHHPVLITVPFTTTEERSALERKVIDAVNQDDTTASGIAFWEQLYFYPYRNMTGKALTPTELYEVVGRELGPFIPEDALDDLERLEALYPYGSQQYSQPIMPTYYNEGTEHLVEGQEWEKERYFVVVDEEDASGDNVELIKLFHVSIFDVYRQACRRAQKAGHRILTQEQEDHASMNSSDEEEGDETIDGGLSQLSINADACSEVGEDEFDYAQRFLGRPSNKWCRLCGIQATPIQASLVSTAVCNLAQANLDFSEYLDSWFYYQQGRANDM